MKPLHKINTWAVAVTLLLFVIPWFGLLAMIPLGIIQLLIAAGISITFYRQLDNKQQKLINYYWLFVIIDFISIATVYFYNGYFNDFYCLSLFILPGCIAFTLFIPPILLQDTSTTSHDYFTTPAHRPSSPRQ